MEPNIHRSWGLGCGRLWAPLSHPPPVLILVPHDPPLGAPRSFPPIPCLPQPRELLGAPGKHGFRSSGRDFTPSLPSSLNKKSSPRCRFSSASPHLLKCSVFPKPYLPSIIPLSLSFFFCPALLSSQNIWVFYCCVLLLLSGSLMRISALSGQSFNMS